MLFAWPNKRRPARAQLDEQFSLQVLKPGRNCYSLARLRYKRDRDRQSAPRRTSRPGCAGVALVSRRFQWRDLITGMELIIVMQKRLHFVMCARLYSPGEREKERHKGERALMAPSHSVAPRETTAACVCASVCGKAGERGSRLLFCALYAQSVRGG